MSEYCSFHGHYDSAEPHCPGCDYDGRPQAGTPPKVKEQGLGDAQLSSSNSNASSAQRAAAPSDPSLNALAMEAAHRVCLYLVEVHNLIVYPRVEKEIASTISRAISAAVKERDERIAELEGMLKDALPLIEHGQFTGVQASKLIRFKERAAQALKGKP